MSNKLVTRGKAERGYTLMLMALGAAGLMGALGIAVDTGLLFVAKGETQAYVDAGALAAALELNGTAAGLANARAAVLASANSWKLNTQTVNSAVVEFSQTSAGPWELNPANPAGYIFSRVRLTVSSRLFFVPVITHAFAQNVVSKAIAGQIDITSFSKGASPYTLVSTNTTGPTFGLVQGASYTIQWPAWNGSNPQCQPGQARRCYVKDPCPDNTNATMWAASQNWSSSVNGYWGFGSNQEIRESVLDGKQTAPVSVGQNIYPLMTNGNMAAQATILDERARQDGYNGNNTVSNYLAAPDANGRRLMLVPVLNPVSPTVTTVLGWGVVLLYSNGASTNFYNQTVNGNDPFCAVYVGPYVVGSNNQGGGGTSGASRVKLVE